MEKEKREKVKKEKEKSRATISQKQMKDAGTDSNAQSITEP